ncbi:MAG TPA: type II secretion system major pseudopilin GspG [Candidatus Hydrogenedentes bacterium]|nr:type II secretion system major pseudopilin GspG [Candidatus Hydrogenedentota bacterium]HQH51968.1 type II secretion system major pseudopilin GspG [Candidatus Hydrogenedentota bacterium]HQM50275.1 type II secretion system major pseudopilin GspG [Candidatus Hydrogenedentota bacterium]
MNSRKRTERRRQEAGFTLVELMVVIVILGLLAALVAPRFLEVADEAHVNTAKAQISHFKTALTQYKLELKKFPSTSEGLEALINNEKSKKFLDSDAVPKDPWGNPYVYTSPGAEGHDFEIISYGADGQKGGTGYNADIMSWNLQGEGQ